MWKTTSGVMKGSRVWLEAAAKATANNSNNNAPKPTNKTFATKGNKNKNPRNCPSSNLSPQPAIVKHVSPAPVGRFIGELEASRTDAFRKILLDYIKLHNLQNPSNEVEIYCDDNLKKIFDGRDKVAIQEIKQLSFLHFVKTG